MSKSKIISDNISLEIDDDKLIPYLYEIINKDFENSKMFETYKNSQLFWIDSSIIEYFVKVFDYVIIHDQNVYFNSELKSNIIDKVYYILNDFQMNKLSKIVFNNGRFSNYKDDITKEIDIIGFNHSTDFENDLSFWYPKTSNIGFKTPETIIINLTKEEVNLIKMGKWNCLSEKDLLKRIKLIASENIKFDLNNKIFIRLGKSSNKFNFDSCLLNNISELFLKLQTIFEDMYFKLEWEEKINLVLREYINTNYKRNKIYNGMPLNSEFRIFYDFDTKQILEVFNYWEKNTMLDNLHNRSDLFTFANTIKEIEEDYEVLVSSLIKEANYKLPNTSLKGKWSVDFMYDGENFILIDMAHAECSYYYDKVLIKQRNNFNIK